MNDTKRTEIFREFYYGIECAGDSHLSKIHIPWITRTTDGYMYSDSTWTHFGASGFRELDWLRIDLTRENRSITDTAYNTIAAHPARAIPGCNAIARSVTENS